VLFGFSGRLILHVLWTTYRSSLYLYTIAYVGAKLEQAFMGWWIMHMECAKPELFRTLCQRRMFLAQVYKHGFPFAEEFRFPFTDVLATHVLVGFILTTFLNWWRKVSFYRPVIFDAFIKNLKIPRSVRRFTMVRTIGKTVMMNKNNADTDAKVSEDISGSTIWTRSEIQTW
jgi:hypothetical protein